MTSAKRSGMRMGYWNTSSLNLLVTERKLKSAMPLPRLSAQIFSSAGTIGRMSVPGARKPCARAPGVGGMRARVHSPEQQPGALDAEPAHMGAHIHA